MTVREVYTGRCYDRFSWWHRNADAPDEILDQLLLVDYDQVEGAGEPTSWWVEYNDGDNPVGIYETIETDTEPDGCLSELAEMNPIEGHKLDMLENQAAAEVAPVFIVWVWWADSKRRTDGVVDYAHPGGFYVEPVSDGRSFPATEREFVTFLYHLHLTGDYGTAVDAALRRRYGID